MEKKISFQFLHGTVEGIYCESPGSFKLVIITNGHNGFYNYGMFPYIQEVLLQNGVSSYSYNFSHGGVNGDSDFFEDLEKYEKNCMRLETLDLIGIIDNIKSSEMKFDSITELYLLTHSLGSIPTIFAAKSLKNVKQIKGIILISSIKTLDVWPKSMIDEWIENKVFFLKNNRTKQELPQGHEFLLESLKSETDWNIKNAISEIGCNDLLFIHGELDRDVPVEHSTSMNQWALDSNKKSEMIIIKNAGHTYNTKHPFEKTSNELNEMLKSAVSWIKK